ncbi:MAG TPA: reverse transcriptase domain-containing protein [Candidatus Nanoarchaeia archaeon]|nr:reverse transcriptase domain-containing protein [Candidatus Nanoarchaeia archaeon]
MQYVIKFQKNLKENILNLQRELKEKTYKPHPLTNFIIRDPKIRTISKSAFVDRIVHHALVQILEPIFDPTFIYDSHANRLGKGTSKALERYDLFLRRLTHNGRLLRGGRTQNSFNFIKGYALKADIKHYFPNINQDILLNIIKRKVKDKDLIDLIKTILDNFNSETKGIGIPLGNLTSQFFANVYLNEFDQFVKHTLKIKYYIRYVDDFVILNLSKEKLEHYKKAINEFLLNNLKVKLHPTKSKIIPLYKGIQLLGFRVFYYHKILRRKAQRRIKSRIEEWKEMYDLGIIERDNALDRLLGWMAYAVNGDTYNLRKKIMAKFNKLIPAEEKPKTTITRYMELIENKTFLSKNKDIKLKIDSSKLDDFTIKALFSYLDSKKMNLLEPKLKEIIHQFITSLKKIKQSNFLPYFGLLLKEDYQIKILIAYNSSDYEFNKKIVKIKDKINLELNREIRLILIKLQDFIIQKDNKENLIIQNAINYGFPIFGNHLYYEIIL